ncbi:MAG: hypothetical protein RLZZ387_2916 [Chloroflexota bacterium]|jgi:site-specific recombinase XerD
MAQHPSIATYLDTFATTHTPATVRAARRDLTQFAAWWEQRRDRAFDPALLRDTDLAAWRIARQRDDGAAPATINRAIAALRAYGAWLAATDLTTENPAASLAILPLPPAAPKALPAGAVDALLRAARAEKDERLRLRDEAILALLVYAGLRVQEVCDVQLRDLDLRAATVTVRYGKKANHRRLPLSPDALTLLKRYLDGVRCSAGTPALGSDAEREPLLVGFDRAISGGVQLGVNQRLVQRVVRARAVEAAERLERDAVKEANLERAGRMLEYAAALRQATPHTLRHSLARRMLDTGADIAAVQRALGHRSLRTTSIYTVPSDDDLREQMRRAGV